MAQPGERWVYNGGATALLGRLIARGTGKSLHAFAREVLFDPLGVGPTDWYAGDDGELIAASGIRITPRDLAKIGQLMLRGGVWDDRVVVPAEWIARCTLPVVPIDEVREYGYHWYLGRIAFETPTAPRWNRSRLERYWSAAGNGGQRLFAFPGLDLLVAVTAGNYDTPDQSVPPARVVREVVLPALL